MNQVYIYHKEEYIRQQLLHILENVDNDFYPPLSSRKSLDFWLNLFDNGTILYVTDSSRVVGFLAYYPTLVGEIYEKLMACVNIKPVTSIGTNGLFLGAYLHFIAILPEYRGKGLSSLLLEALISEAKQKRIPSIRVITWSTNRNSIKLYQKHGFKEIYNIPNERGNGIGTIYLEVTLPTLEPRILVRKK